jgi:hypothetical protein
MPTNANAFANH